MANDLGLGMGQVDLDLGLGPVAWHGMDQQDQSRPDPWVMGQLM